MEKILIVVGISVYEVDICLFECYLMECFINVLLVFQGVDDGYGVLVEVCICVLLGYCLLFRLVLLDIEISWEGEFYSIVIEGCGQCSVYVLGLFSGVVVLVDFVLQFCQSCKELIDCFNEWVVCYDLDVLIGWNLVQFDFNVLQKQVQKYYIMLCLGCVGWVLEWCEYGMCVNYLLVNVVGWLVIDGIESLCGVFWNFLFFSLENVV